MAGGHAGSGVRPGVRPKSRPGRRANSKSRPAGQGPFRRRNKPVINQGIKIFRRSGFLARGCVIDGTRCREAMQAYQHQETRLADLYPYPVPSGAGFRRRRHPARALLAGRLAETDGNPHRHHSAARLLHPARADRRLLGDRQGARRDLDGDRGARVLRLHLRGTGQAPAALAQHRRGRDLRDLRAVGAHVLPRAAEAGAEPHGRIHEVDQLPVPVHRVDHRRQHPEHGSPRADPGLREDLHPARGRLGRGRDRRHGGRHRARPRRAPHAAVHRRADHGGRRRRRRDSAVDRLFGTDAPAARRDVRDGAAAGDARQPDRDHPVRRARHARQALPAPDRQRPPAGRRIGRHDARERKSAATSTSRTSRAPASRPSRCTWWA